MQITYKFHTRTTFTIRNTVNIFKKKDIIRTNTNCPRQVLVWNLTYHHKQNAKKRMKKMIEFNGKIHRE